MASYIIGDLQGCYLALQKLLDTLAFSPSRDHLYFLGDVVNRGEGSLEVLRFLHKNASSVSMVLGNHDLHLLAVAHQFRKSAKSDTLDNILQAPDKGVLISWLFSQPLAIYLKAPVDMMLIHAGVLPQWNKEDILRLGEELEGVFKSEEKLEVLRNLFGNVPATFNEDLMGFDRYRCIANAFTRLRFCTTQGEMDFHGKGAANTAPKGFYPWFNAPQRKSESTTIAFGHWSTLGKLERPHLYALDSGCVWGGPLTALKIDSSGNNAHEKIEVFV